MLDFSPKKICSTMPTEHLIRMIDFTHQRDKKTVCKVYGNKIQQYFPGGFRDISKVNPLMVKQNLKEQCVSNERFAVVILESWFNINKSLRDRVSKELNERGYVPADPDFLNLNIQSLRKEDIIGKDDKSYFKTKNHDVITITELFDITLMAILLGWYPLNDDKEIAKKNGETEETDLENDKYIINEIETSEILISTYEANKEGSMELLNRIKEEIQSDDVKSFESLNDELNILSKIQKELKKHLHSIEKELKKYLLNNEDGLISDDLSNFSAFDKEQILSAKFKILKVKYEELMKVENESASQKLKEACEMILNLPTESRDKFLNRFTIIEKDQTAVNLASKA